MMSMTNSIFFNVSLVVGTHAPYASASSGVYFFPVAGFMAGGCGAYSFLGASVLVVVPSAYV